MSESERELLERLLQEQRELRKILMAFAAALSESYQLNTVPICEEMSDQTT